MCKTVGMLGPAGHDTTSLGSRINNPSIISK
uniref:Uncharacterized protein n=1 Tax=Timema genevievae TaxID=629358 RepID=A0A7R9PN35_TIMGE|nr:unnamed protein product [Timema genevievae]